MKSIGFLAKIFAASLVPPQALPWSSQGSLVTNLTNCMSANSRISCSEVNQNLYHSKMSERLNDRLFLLFRCLRWPAVLTLQKIVILPFYDPTFSLRLRDIQVRHMEPVFFLYPLLDLFVCGTLPETRHIHLLEREFNSDILARYVSLGKLDNRLDMARGNETTKSYLRQ